MRVLITGATGFIGSQLVHAARSRGHEVVATGLANNAAEARRLERLEQAGVRVREGSLRVSAFADSVVEGCEVVVHLAAAQHEAGMPEAYFYDVNVDATERLLAASVRSGVRRFVYGSTIGVYGDGGEGRLAEDSVLAPATLYGKSKQAAEHVVRAYADRLEIVIARISEAYGPEDYRLLKLFKMAERGLTALVGPGRNLHQPIHVDELTRGLMCLAEHPAAANETFILAGPTPITTREMLDAISAAVGTRVRTLRLPESLMCAAARATEALCKRLAIAPPLHRRRLDFFTKSFSFTTEKAERLLGFKSVIPFAAGARDTLGWYRNMGLLAPHAPSSRGPNDRLPPDVPLAADAAAPLNLADILEFTHDAIIVWEMEGAGIVYWNRAAEQLYGYTRQEAHGRSTHLLLHTELEGGVEQLEGKLSRYGVWVGQLRHRKRDGAAVSVDARLALMAQRDGRWLVLEVNRELSRAAPYPPVIDSRLANPTAVQPERP